MARRRKEKKALERRVALKRLASPPTSLPHKVLGRPAIRGRRRKGPPLEDVQVCSGPDAPGNGRVGGGCGAQLSARWEERLTSEWGWVGLGGSSGGSSRCLRPRR